MQRIHLQKIVSGGQTGVDRGALDAALELGFPCGGWCPRGRLAEDGPIDPRYPLTELQAGGYQERTLRNVLDSDGTAIIHFGELEGGTAQTLLFCVRQGRPVTRIDGGAVSPRGAAQLIAVFVREHAIRVLNVAGPRQSKVPGARDYVLSAVRMLLEAAQRRAG